MRPNLNVSVATLTLRLPPTALRIDPIDTGYQALAAAVERAINEADSIGLLETGAPADEYGPEIGTMLPLLANAQRPDDVTGVLFGEFLRGFGEGTGGPRQAYEASLAR
jgi:hypothetical protein